MLGKKAVKILISAFILAHLSLMFLWDIPPCSIKKILLEQTRLGREAVIYMRWAGLGHSWKMFAPNVPQLSSRFESEITFRDGTKKVWVHSPAEDRGFSRKFFTLRNCWQNFFYGYPAAWPEVARYIARFHANPENPPTAVSITHLIAVIPPLDPGKPVPPVPNRYEHPYRKSLITYTVSAKDLT